MVFVNVQGADSITVRLINETASEFAVELTLDGLSAFLFNEEEPYLYYTVAPNSTLDVNGWYVNRNASYCFELVNYAERCCPVIESRQRERGGCHIGLLQRMLGRKAQGAGRARGPSDPTRSRVNANFDIVRRFVSPTGRLLSARYNKKDALRLVPPKAIQASFPSPSSNVRDVNRSLASSAEMPPPRPATRDQHPCAVRNRFAVAKVTSSSRRFARQRRRSAKNFRESRVRDRLFSDPPARDRAHARPPSPPEAVEREA